MPRSGRSIDRRSEIGNEQTGGGAAPPVPSGGIGREPGGDTHQTHEPSSQYDQPVQACSLFYLTMPNVERNGLYLDTDVNAALGWLAEVSGDPADLHSRIERAQSLYRQYVATEPNLGKDPTIEALGPDKVASYLGQADALGCDRAAYDLVLSSRIVPFIKHIGSAIELLRGVRGASERAARMLKQRTVDPDSAIFELAIAAAYVKAGFAVEFLAEAPPERRPDFRVERGGRVADVECKRIQQTSYAKSEEKQQGQICDKLSELIHHLRLSIHIDVVYTRELSEVPANYLFERVNASLNARIVTFGGFPWKDGFGEGVIRPADLAAVHRDALDSSLYFGTKLARLLSGVEVTQDAYNLVGSGKPDQRDVRYLEQLDYCTVVTWACSAEASIDARARFIRSKLAEVDQQMHASPAGIAHVGMEAQRDTHTSDIRRARNIEAVRTYHSNSEVAEIYLHYFVPLTTEVNAWTIDETVDRFGKDPADRIGLDRIFDRAEIADNDLPAWYQPRPTHTE